MTGEGGDEPIRSLRGEVYLTYFGQMMRLRPTRAEDILWRFIKGKQLGGYKFRRQHGIGRYIADFYCSQVKLVVEVDGEIHSSLEVKQKDQIRAEYFLELGYSIIRFTNDQVYNGISSLLTTLELKLAQLTMTQTSSPSHGRDRGG